MGIFFRKAPHFVFRIKFWYFSAYNFSEKSSLFLLNSVKILFFFESELELVILCHLFKFASEEKRNFHRVQLITLPLLNSAHSHTLIMIENIFLCHSPIIVLGFFSPLSAGWSSSRGQVDLMCFFLFQKLNIPVIGSSKFTINFKWMKG